MKKIAFLMALTASSLYITTYSSPDREVTNAQFQEYIDLITTYNTRSTTLLYNSLKRYPREKLYALAHRVEKVSTDNLGVVATSLIRSLPSYHLARNIWCSLNNKPQTRDLSDTARVIHHARQEMLKQKLSDDPIARVCLYLYQRVNSDCNGIIDAKKQRYYQSNGIEKSVGENDMLILRNRQQNERYFFMKDNTAIYSLRD